MKYYFLSKITGKVFGFSLPNKFFHFNEINVTSKISITKLDIFNTKLSSKSS